MSAFWTGVLIGYALGAVTMVWVIGLCHAAALGDGEVRTDGHHH